MKFHLRVAALCCIGWWFMGCSHVLPFPHKEGCFEQRIGLTQDNERAGDSIYAVQTCGTLIPLTWSGNDLTLSLTMEIRPVDEPTPALQIGADLVELSSGKRLNLTAVEGDIHEKGAPNIHVTFVIPSKGSSETFTLSDVLANPQGFTFMYHSAVIGLGGCPSTDPRPNGNCNGELTFPVPPLSPMS